MKNMIDLRTELAQVFDELRSGSIKPKEAAEMNNTAGKIINSVKVELDYYALRKEKPSIPFLSVDTDSQSK